MALKGLRGLRIKKKAQRVTRSQEYLTNLKYLGEEPAFPVGHRVTDSEKARSFTWYNYMATPDDARGYLNAYLEKRGHRELRDSVRDVPDNCLPLTAAWLSRMDDMGADIGDSHDFIVEKVKHSLRFVKQKEEADPDAPQKPTIQDNMERKVGVFISDIECVIDRKEWTFNVYEALKANSFPVNVVNQIGDHYAPLRDELKQVVANTDPSLYEGYRNVPKRLVKAQLEWVDKLISDCRNYGANERKLRAPRKKKPPSVEKQLKHFVYKKEDVELKIASVNPAEIIGAQEVWLYSCKYRTLTVLRARGPAGLSVNRRAIEGYDEATSMTKAIGRKAAEWIKETRERGKNGLKRLMDDVKSAQGKPAFRSSEETVILRVVR